MIGDRWTSWRDRNSEWFDAILSLAFLLALAAAGVGLVLVAIRAIG